MENNGSIPTFNSVDLARPSYYHGPQANTFGSKLHHWRLWINYLHYKRLICRYSNVPTSIAEVSCGSGTLLRFLESWFPEARISGFDYDPRLLREVQGKIVEASLVLGNAEELPFAENEFDVLLSLHTIEHLFRPERMISEAYRVLQNGGLFVLATPNPAGIGARAMGSRWEGWRDDHVAVKRPDEWADLLKTHGFVRLQERTTFLSGIPLFRSLPLAVFNWGVLALVGSLPWSYGEAYIGCWQKQKM